MFTRLFHISKWQHNRRLGRINCHEKEGPFPFAWNAMLAIIIFLPFCHLCYEKRCPGFVCTGHQKSCLHWMLMKMVSPTSTCHVCVCEQCTLICVAVILFWKYDCLCVLSISGVWESVESKKRISSGLGCPSSCQNSGWTIYGSCEIQIYFAMSRLFLIYFWWIPTLISRSDNQVWETRCIYLRLSTALNCAISRVGGDVSERWQEREEDVST